MQPEQLTVSELKGRLKELNLPLNGRKVISLMNPCSCGSCNHVFSRDS